MNEAVKNTFLFLGGFLNVAVIATIVIVVLLVIWGRRRGDRNRESFLSDDDNRKQSAPSLKDESRDGKAR